MVSSTEEPSGGASRPPSFTSPIASRSANAVSVAELSETASGSLVTSASPLDRSAPLDASSSATEASTSRGPSKELPLSLASGGPSPPEIAGSSEEQPTDEPSRLPIQQARRTFRRARKRKSMVDEPSTVGRKLGRRPMQLSLRRRYLARSSWISCDPGLARFKTRVLRDRDSASPTPSRMTMAISARPYVHEPAST